MLLGPLDQNQMHTALSFIKFMLIETSIAELFYIVIVDVQLNVLV